MAVSSKAGYLLAVVVLVTACEPGPIEPDTSQTDAPPAAFRWSCYDPDDNHCVNEPLGSDPNPSAPGYHIGELFTMDDCTNILLSVDSDGDGFDDMCEYRLARAFAPMLRVSADDSDVTREPYWVATYRPEDFHIGITHHVSIMYLLAYHTDYGFWWTGHEGDSEFIIVDLFYNENTLHWDVWQVYLSAHWGTHVSSSEYFDARDFEFPHHEGGYPLVYVSKDKHANFASKSRCDAYQDTCPNMMDDGRVTVIESRNLGSGDVRLRNTVSSQQPYSYGGQESFWTANSFCGWWLGATDCSTGYRFALEAFGF